MVASHGILLRQAAEPQLPSDAAQRPRQILLSVIHGLIIQRPVPLGPVIHRPVDHRPVIHRTPASDQRFGECG